MLTKSPLDPLHRSTLGAGPASHYTSKYPRLHLIDALWTPVEAQVPIVERPPFLKLSHPLGMMRDLGGSRAIAWAIAWADARALANWSLPM